MQANASQFASICQRYFLRIGTFQRVTGKGNKKISSTLRLAWRVVVAAFQTAPAPVPPGSERERNSVQQNIVRNISVFVKAIRSREQTQEFARPNALAGDELRASRPFQARRRRAVRTASPALRP